MRSDKRNVRRLVQRMLLQLENTVEEMKVSDEFDIEELEDAVYNLHVNLVEVLQEVPPSTVKWHLSARTHHPLRDVANLPQEEMRPRSQRFSRTPRREKRRQTPKLRLIQGKKSDAQ